jgi:hypothetical protein
LAASAGGSASAARTDRCSSWAGTSFSTRDGADRDRTELMWVDVACEGGEPLVSSK